LLGIASGYTGRCGGEFSRAIVTGVMIALIIISVLEFRR